MEYRPPLRIIMTGSYLPGDRGILIATNLNPPKPATEKREKSAYILKGTIVDRGGQR